MNKHKKAGFSDSGFLNPEDIKGSPDMKENKFNQQRSDEDDMDSFNLDLAISDLEQKANAKFEEGEYREAAHAAVTTLTVLDNMPTDLYVQLSDFVDTCFDTNIRKYKEKECQKALTNLKKMLESLKKERQSVES